MSFDGNDHGTAKTTTTGVAENRLSGTKVPAVPRRTSTDPRLGTTESRRSWRRFVGYAVAGGLAASALGVGLRPWLLPQSRTATALQSESEKPRPVQTTLPHQQTLSAVTLPATVEAFQSARLFSRVAGYVKAWHVEIGQDVEAGDLLVEIDTPELDQELLQARADLGIARAAVVQADAELTESVATLDQAKADRSRAAAEVELAGIRLKRRQTLLAQQATTQEEYDTAIRDRDARQAEVTASDATITRQQAAIGTRRAVVESRKASVESALANVRRLEEMQSFQKIVAPFSAVVTQRTAEVGNLVTAGNSTASAPLYQLAQTDRVRVQVSVPQAEAVGVAAGSEVTVRVPEQPGRDVTARVTRTSRSVDPGTRTLLAEIELPNTGGLFPPGIYAEVAVTTHSPEATWLIPTNTVRMQVDGPHVVLANDRNELQVRSVRLGRDFGRSVAVLEGVTGAERLVVNPTDDLRDGMPVSVEQPQNAAPVVASR